MCAVPESPDVFVSFASADAELAHRAVDALEGAGIRCWISDRDIRMATSYPAAITAAIEDCGAFLLLLTETSNASRHVLREVELAFNARRPILPVRIAGAMPTSDFQYFLSTSQWLDAGPAFDHEDLAKIAPVLRELVAGSSLRPQVTETTRARWIWIAAAATLVLAGGIALMIWSRGETAPPRLEMPAPAGSPGAVLPRSATPAAKVNPRDGQTYMWIAPGSFMMGCSDGDPSCGDDEKPVHAVEITRGFWLARTEVTVAQFRRTTSAASSDNDAGTTPVTGVDWSEAKAYCARVGGRLPTEAEWEYAARAGVRARYYGSPAAIAWFSENTDDRPHPVATKAPNAFGLYDMLGNVSEWVLDRYYNAYDETSDPLEPDQPLAGNASAVARGGSWTSDATGLRVSRRIEMPPDAAEPHIGFRCVVNRL